MSEITRSHLPTDYDEYAPTYAWARFPVRWVLESLASLVASKPSQRILEIGCGTANYARALAEAHPGGTFLGLDLSVPMLREARAAGSPVALVCGDASKMLPFADRTFDLAFAVDVIHHINDTRRFFAEANRVLSPGGLLVIVTDSEETLRRRSLTKFFPEILPLELARYPTIGQLHSDAEQMGLEFVGRKEVSGHIPLEESFLGALASKCSSAMRLITTREHAAGLKRVKAAQAAGEQWFSCYDVLQYARPGR